MTRSLPLLALAIAVGNFHSAFAQSITWELANEYPATSLAAEGDQYFADLVRVRTNDRVHILPRPNGALGYKSREQLAAVASGKVMMADSFVGSLGDDNAIFLLSSLPLRTPSVAEARRLYDAARPAYEHALSARGQKLLFASPWPPSGIWARRAVTSNEVLRSLKIRTYDASSADVMQHAGAQAFNLSFNEVAAKLEAGEINAVLSSGDGGAGRALWKYLPVFTEINYAIPLSLVTVNLPAWNLLDAPTRAAIVAAAEETQARQWQQMQGRVAQNYARMKENGMQIETTLPPEVVDALAAASGAVVEAWLKKVGPEGKELLEGFRKGPGSGR